MSDKTNEYAAKVYELLKAAKVRTVLDDRDEKIGYKIREAQMVDRAPYMLVLGPKEAEENSVSVRSRDTGETVTMSVDEFISKVTTEISERYTPLS